MSSSRPARATSCSAVVVLARRLRRRLHMVNLSLWRPLLFVLSLDSHVHSGTALVTVRQAPTFPTTSGTGTALGNFPPHHFRYTYGARHGAAGAYVPTTRVYVRRGHFQHGAVTVRRAPTFLRRTYFRRSHFRHGAVTAVRRAPTFLRVRRVHLRHGARHGAAGSFFLLGKRGRTGRAEPLSGKEGHRRNIS